MLQPNTMHCLPLLGPKDWPPSGKVMQQPSESLLQKVSVLSTGNAQMSHLIDTFMIYSFNCLIKGRLLFPIP